MNMQWRVAASAAVFACCAVSAGEHDEPKLLIREVVGTYPVAARDEDELLERMDADDEPSSAPHGLTEGRYLITRRLTQKPDLCLVDAITLEVEITMTLPAWESGLPIPTRLRTRWQDLSAWITAHEERHRQNLLDAAFAMRDRISVMPVQPRCQQVEALLRRIVATEEAKRRFADDFVDQQRVLLPRR